MATLPDRTELTTPADGDLYVTTDVSDTTDAATGTDKKITWSNIKAGMKTYMDTLYQPLASVLTNTTASFTSALETKLNGIEASADVTDAGNVGAVNAAAASKTTPVDADSVPIVNSESADAIGRVTFTNLKAFLKTYFDTLYQAAGSYLTAADISDTAYGAGWDTDTTHAPSKNAVYDEMELRAPKASPSFTGTVTLPTGLTGVLRADSGVVSTDSDVTDLVSAASDTAAGKVELAIASEINTGTDATRAVTPDSLAGSYAGTKSLSVQVTDGTTSVATGDGKAYITIPESLNGMNLIRAQATVVTAGTTNATTVMIHNKTDTQDMLSGAISIASGGTVGTVGTINATYDDVATNDVLRIDVDSVSTTAPKGLMVVLEFRLA